VLFQIWAFVAPGLLPPREAVRLPLLISEHRAVLHRHGVRVLVVFKVMFGFFAKSVPGGVVMSPDIDAYLDFVLGMFLGFVLAFETPIADDDAGVERARSDQGDDRGPRLRLSRLLRRGHAARADVFSMTLLAVPSTWLYEARPLGRENHDARKNSGGKRSWDLTARGSLEPRRSEERKPR